MLDHLSAAAIHDAVRRIESESQQRMSAAMSGMRLPPGIKMPF
jgi:DNA-binding protein YbaB